MNKMFSSFCVLLLGTVVMPHAINAAPYKDIGSATRALAERLILTNLATAELLDITVLQFRNGKEVMEQVLKDPKVVEIDLMKSNLDELRTIVNRFEEFEHGLRKNKEKRKEILNYYYGIIYKYTRDVPLEAAEDKVIRDSFKEKGYVHFSESVENRVKIFTDKFFAQVQKYFNGLSEEEKKEESELLEFMDKFKAESNIKKRGDLVLELIGGFNIENLLW